MAVPTRWYSQAESVANVLLNKDVFQMIAANSSVMSRFSRSVSNEFKAPIQSDSFWEKAERLYDLLLPPTQAIGKMESNSCMLPEVYITFKNLWKHGTYANNPALQDIVKARMDFLVTESMLWSILFDPTLKGGRGIFIDADCSEAMHRFLKHLKMFYPLDNEYMAAKNEVLQFLKQARSGGDPTFAEQIDENNVLQWWTFYGAAKYPLLFPIVERFYSVPTSSAAAERAWSVASLIHTKRRNRLSKERLTKLAYIYMNSRYMNPSTKTKEQSSRGETDDAQIDYIVEQTAEEEEFNLDFSDSDDPEEAPEERS